MKRGIRGLSRLTVVTAFAAALAACPAPDPERAPPVDEPDPAVEERVRVYEAQLEQVGGSGVTGTATIAVGDGLVQVRVMVQGLRPEQRVPQHVHMNATCDLAGGILLNLDSDLSYPNEAAPRGDHYPAADGDGVLDLSASRSFEDLRHAAREHQGTEPEQLDLGNRVVNLHGEDMQPIACGALQERPGAEMGLTQPPL
jgi:hypothetical protein